MDLIARLTLAGGFLWAVVALTLQARRAGRFTRGFHTPAVGSPGRAMLYNFTTAMLPSHKESVSKHPLSFGAGMLLHVGVFASLTMAMTSLFSKELFELQRGPIGIVALVGVAAFLFLFLRRFIDSELRTISVPDDFIASAMVGFFLVATVATSRGWISMVALQLITAHLFFYLPMGKLRHALFFFLARAELAHRLGWRGVYPPAAPEVGHD